MRLYPSRAARVRAERRFRSALRAGLIGATLTALAAGIGLTALPAGAATTTLSVRAVGGDGQVTAAWSAVPGATGYTVHYGKGTSTARTVTTRATSVRLTSLANRSSYSVRVTANGVSASSARVTATPVPYVPTSISWVKAVPAGPNQIKVTWSGGDRARSFAIMAGADSMTKISHFSTAWHPAAIQSWTLTVPTELRSVLGAGTGNVVFVKVVLSNSTQANPVKHFTFNLADKYRLTPSGTWSLAGAAPSTSSVTRISVGTWNVQSITATAKASTQNQWMSSRLDRVTANIQTVHPDLLGLQELTTARIDPGCLNHGGLHTCKEQYQTLQDSLRNAAIPYRNAREDANDWVYTQSGTYVDSALFYNPAKLTVVRSGFISPKALLGSAWPSSLSNMAGMWAEFSTVPGPDRPARVFLAVSIHLPVGASTALGDLRRKEAIAIAKDMEAKALLPDSTRLPVVFTGDLNAFGAWDSRAGNRALSAMGYFDAAATTNRNVTHMRLSTDNATNGTGGTDLGYPNTVVLHPYPTSRIDYIMLKRSQRTDRYDNVVPMSAGKFVKRLQGSDHNMQFAIVGITDPS